MLVNDNETPHRGKYAMSKEDFVFEFVLRHAAKHGVEISIQWAERAWNALIKWKAIQGVSE